MSIPPVQAYAPGESIIPVGNTVGNHSFTTYTSDNFLLMPVLFLLTLSFAGLTVLAYKRKEF